jgi:hypothetical protein
MLNRTATADDMDKQNSYGVFKCNSNEMISMFARCDAVIDCIGGSDELNCSYSEGNNCYLFRRARLLIKSNFLFSFRLYVLPKEFSALPNANGQAQIM